MRQLNGKYHSSVGALEHSLCRFTYTQEVNYNLNNAVLLIFVITSICSISRVQGGSIFCIQRVPVSFDPIGSNHKLRP